MFSHVVRLIPSPVPRSTHLLSTQWYVAGWEGGPAAAMVMSEQLDHTCQSKGFVVDCVGVSYVDDFVLLCFIN